MGRTVVVQNAFTAGELTPKLDGRLNVERVQQGLSECLNMLPLPQGGLTRRPGTRYVGEAFDSTRKPLLVPFQVGASAAYVLLFGHQKMRAYTDGGQVQSGGSPYEISTPYAEADLPALRWAQAADVLYLAHPFHPPRVLTRTGAATWALTDLALVDGPYLGENTDQTKTVSASGTGEHVKNGTFDNSAEHWTDKSTGTNAKILWEAGGYLSLIGVSGGSGYAEQAVTVPQVGVAYTLTFTVMSGPITLRVGTSSGGQEVLADAAYEKGTHTVTITPGALGLYLGFLHTANAARAIESVSLFRSVSVTLTANFAAFASVEGRSRVGQLWRLRHGAQVGYCRITAVSSDTQATATIVEPLGSVAPTHTWNEGAWCPAYGYPSCVVLHQGRLTLGGSLRQPQTVWLSRSAVVEDFTPDTVADAAITLTLGGGQFNAVQALVSAKNLLVLTTGGEWRVGSSDGALTPTNAIARQDSAHGSDSCQPVQVGNSVLFVQRGGRKIRELAYDFSADGWIASDLTVLADHLASPGIAASAYAQEPFLAGWWLRADGVIVAMVYHKGEQVLAFSRITLGGAGSVESLAVIHEGEQDRLYLVVKRTVSGVTKRWIEYVEAPLDDKDAQDAYYVDAGLTYRGTPAATISGLAHLNGQTVAVCADGGQVAPCVVASGSITLPQAASVAHVGLSFVSRLTTMPLPVGPTGARGRVSGVSARFWQTLGVRVGPPQGPLDEVSFRTSADPLGQPPALTSRVMDLTPAADFGQDVRVTLEQPHPLPLTVLSLTYVIQTGDR